MYFSRMEAALGLISLKRKTNQLKPDTLLKRRVSCIKYRLVKFHDCTIKFLYTKYPLEDGKLQEKFN